ncbi:hypothetical protein MPC4_270059 [Methylocella tundrae]|uniref:Uncharacterized protein n=1 Tax=Methylocella tundrae TaxID=227605 RepID=A0A8B6M7H0_METTU|nr:hypothetical protein MPC1_11940001 [Methylocella tundrae]VTZ50698.1 hypothetical protein MPC4_270059 [Methylocella tundrae]
MLDTGVTAGSSKITGAGARQISWVGDDKICVTMIVATELVRRAQRRKLGGACSADRRPCLRATPLSSRKHARVSMRRRPTLENWLTQQLICSA